MVPRKEPKDTGNAFTTVFAGCAFTITPVPVLLAQMIHNDSLLDHLLQEHWDWKLFSTKVEIQANSPMRFSPFFALVTEPFEPFAGAISFQVSKRIHENLSQINFQITQTDVIYILQVGENRFSRKEETDKATMLLAHQSTKSPFF